MSIIRRDKDNLYSDTEPMRCVCGSIARVRYRIPVIWVECKKKCGMKTGYYPDVDIQADPEAIKKAVEEWNRMVSKHG